MASTLSALPQARLRANGREEVAAFRAERKGGRVGRRGNWLCVVVADKFSEGEKLPGGAEADAEIVPPRNGWEIRLGALLTFAGEVLQVGVTVESGAMPVAKVESHRVVADDVPASHFDAGKRGRPIPTVLVSEHVAFADVFGTGRGGA